MKDGLAAYAIHYIDGREAYSFSYQGRAGNDVQDVNHGWRYINGPLICQPLPAPVQAAATGG
ncbi:hypothetical protein [Duganella sp. BuS-21]|uniref:hypothetical protein n=1 Tax=Duganella sp. BuS-21 TaxID=2943848 RepID=UPI0035A62E97